MSAMEKRYIFLIICVCFGLYFGQGEELNCMVGEGFLKWTGDGQCYKFIDVNVLFSEANDTCQSFGAYPTSLKSEAQETFIFDDLMSGVAAGSIWIGLYQGSDGNYYWYEDNSLKGSYGDSPSGQFCFTGISISTAGSMWFYRNCNSQTTASIICVMPPTCSQNSTEPECLVPSTSPLPETTTAEPVTTDEAETTVAPTTQPPTQTTAVTTEEPSTTTTLSLTTTSRAQTTTEAAETTSEALMVQSTPASVARTTAVTEASSSLIETTLGDDATTLSNGVITSTAASVVSSVILVSSELTESATASTHLSTVDSTSTSSTTIPGTSYGLQTVATDYMVSSSAASPSMSELISTKATTTQQILPNGSTEKQSVDVLTVGVGAGSAAALVAATAMTALAAFILKRKKKRVDQLNDLEEEEDSFEEEVPNTRPRNTDTYARRAQDLTPTTMEPEPLSSVSAEPGARTIHVAPAATSAGLSKFANAVNVVRATQAMSKPRLSLLPNYS